MRRNHNQDMKNKKMTKVVIEHDTFIGAGCIILKGITSGAGSVVSQNIPPRQIWTGNPVKFIRNI